MSVINPSPAQAPAVPTGADDPLTRRLDLLQRPVGVRGKITWRYAIPILVIHLMALAAVLPWLFTLSGLIIFVVGVYVFGASINIGYHRLLTHRSFACPRWVEHLLVTLSVCCLEDAPATWVATHRLHHKDSDQTPDPHSPKVNFWWGHMGWLLVENRDLKNMGTYDRFARDVLKDPYYLWLQRGWTVGWIYLAHALLFFSAGFGVGWWLGGEAEAGMRTAVSWLLWGVFLRTVAVWHITWSVNSLSHLFGYRNYDTGEQSRNNWLVALLASGEGWHNNHHADPNSASNWHHWWEIDPMYLVIRALELVGLAQGVNRGNPKRRVRHAGARRQPPGHEDTSSSFSAKSAKPPAVRTR